jgi:hypothetical protein
VHYLRVVGYDLSRVEQTGSNFGTDVKHEIPLLCSIGSGTMVADGLSMINSEFSSTSFRVSRVFIGPRNFLGNRIAYPARGRTGDNCLLATKVMVPVDGPVREGVGLLGSPSFEIPRSVDRDSRFDELKDPDELRRRLAAKNRHNAATMALFLCSRWMYVYGLILLAGLSMVLHDSFGILVIAMDIAMAPVFTVIYFVLVERFETALHALRPLYCSIYDRDFWRRERYWKVPSEMYPQAFNGTPFKNVVWRLLGVRVGRRVFDDGCYLTERALASIGSDCTLNTGCVIQCHSQEDGTFKSERTAIGAGCTLGVGAFVHYGVTVGDGAVLAADSFLMKGEDVPPHARWEGNPARAVVGRPALAFPPSTRRPALRPALVRLGAAAAPVCAFLLAAVPLALLGPPVLAGLNQADATAGETVLAAGVALHPGSPLAPVGWPDTFVVRQLAAIDSLIAWPGPRNVVDAARTTLLALGALGCLLLWPVARRLGASAPGAALAVALCGFPALVCGLYCAVDPGTLAALWLTVAAALVGPSRSATFAAVGAAALAVLTAPLAAVLPLILAGYHASRAGRSGGRRRGARALSLALVVAAGYVAVRGIGLWPTGSEPWSGSGRGPVPPVLLVGFLAAGAVVATTAWARVVRLRPTVTATGAMLACAAIPGPHSTTALLVALPVLALLAALVLDELTVTVRWSRPVLLATVLAVGTAAGWTALGSPAMPGPTRNGLSAWIATQLDPAVGLRVDPLTGAQLLRDGVATERLTPADLPAGPDTMIVAAVAPGTAASTAPPGARLLVTVPDGPGHAPISVLQPDPGPDRTAVRRVVGSWLAAHPALTLTPAAADALRGGQIDLRLATALSSVAAEHRLTVAGFVAVPGEPADAVRRTALITEVDGTSAAAAGATDRLRRQLADQPSSYRPASATVQRGVLVVQYTTPAQRER